MSIEFHSEPRPGFKRWKCTECGHVTNPTKFGADKVRHECVMITAPGVLARGSAFSMALAKHVKLGMPKVNDGTRGERLSTCLNCPDNRYDLHNEMCIECGCACTGKAVFWNKLDWADQGCPLGHWPPVIQIEHKESSDA